MGALRTTLHPACRVLSQQQGCDQGSGASRGCARLQTQLRWLPSPFPGKQPVPAAEPRVNSQDGALGQHRLPATSPGPGVPQPSPVEPLRGGCSRHPHGCSAPSSAPADLLGSCLNPRSSACPPGRCPGVTSPQSPPCQWQRGLATISAEPRAIFWQYFHNILVWGQKNRKIPKYPLFTPVWKLPPKASCFSAWRDTPREPPSHAPAPAPGTVSPPPCAPICPGSPLPRHGAREKQHHMKLGNFVAGKFEKMEAKQGDGVGAGTTRL